MKEARRIKITTTQRRILRVRPTAVRAVCPVCAREVETLSTGEAAAVLEVDDLIFHGLLTAGQIHTIRTVSGSLRVCQDSLWVSGCKRLRRAETIGRNDDDK